VTDDSDGKPPDEALNDCEEKIAELEEENSQLRYAAETFGDLAERLNNERRAAEGEPPTVPALKDEKSQTGGGHSS
jgi:hypothetical protein